MASLAVMDAVDARLAANWTRCAIVADDTTGQGPADGSPYLTVEYPVAREEQITVGSPGANVFRETGVIRLVLVQQTGTGRRQPVQWMDELRALFRSTLFSGVTTFAPSPAIVDPANYAGGKFKVSCAVPYYFDLFA
ncbi:phage tail terminator-like protein [Bradyrhizobium sp. SZCCHNR1020]|uniref:phage tail terminator-like protein n=1 Tax=Bradyrhizobium sp. SZCCHNR1020 TaxID=3057343 RepID=UPI002916D382|nr:phage tail terminator-like protein [Bradyrhizobium sp. SZCCHNR1020]